MTAQIRDPLSPGYVLNPAVVPAHDPSVVTTLPHRTQAQRAEQQRLGRGSGRGSGLVHMPSSGADRPAGMTSHLEVAADFQGFRHYSVERFAETMRAVGVGSVGWPGALDDPVVTGLRGVAHELGRLVVVALGSRGYGPEASAALRAADEAALRSPRARLVSASGVTDVRPLPDPRVEAERPRRGAAGRTATPRGGASPRRRPVARGVPRHGRGDSSPSGH